MFDPWETPRVKLTTPRRWPRTAYLAGPMEFAENAGIGWRLQFETALKPLVINCIIPEQEEEEITDQDELNHLKKHDPKEYVKIMRKLIDLDLQFVHDVDLVIINWEGERMSGTIGEAQEAYLNDVPVHLVTSKPTHEIPGWFLACCSSVHNSLDDLLSHLDRKP